MQMQIFTNVRIKLKEILFNRFYCTKEPIMKYLNVAEKNDAAKNIASILSRGNSQRREGLSPYNKIYEFNAQVFGENCKMTMTSVSGHLLNYEFASNFRNWQSCNPLVLFDAQIIKACTKEAEKIKKTLEREIRTCQGLIIWTDCDREGENIGFEIINVCTHIKPNLKIYRAKFSEIAAASVFRALNTLGQPNKRISDAVDVRQEMDLRTGAAFTRLQTLRLQQVFPRKLAEKLISYGPCQFPTLGFVVERYQQIENFIPEPFWKIVMNHKVKDLTTEFLWKRNRLFDKNSCEAILDHCRDTPLAKVEFVDSRPKSKWRPLPLDTIEFEKSMSKKLKINAKEAMKIAEKLYTQGYISYPRTETNVFPKEINLSSLVEHQRNAPDWGTFAQRIMTEGGPNPRQGKKSDQAHPPIHPTKYADNLSGNDKRVYEFIVRHFLACVHKDAQGFETTVQADIAGEKFTAKGLIILEKNYLDVYVYEKWNAKEINNYETGDTFTPTKLDIVESTTSAPKLLTEADLIALMEKHGIGTDATHAEHIETIKSREYVGLNDIYFVPGTLGMGLVEGYNNIGLEVSLAKPILRAEFENDLKLICDGVKDPQSVLNDQIAKYKAVFQTVVEKMGLIDDSLAHRLLDTPQPYQNQISSVNADDFKRAMKCPKCGNDMILRNKKDQSAKFLTCTGYPGCKNAVWFPSIATNVEVADQTCSECGPNYNLLKFTFRPNPFPGDPNPNTLCIGGCDNNVIEVLDINLNNVRQSTNSSISTNHNNSYNNRNENTSINNYSTTERINQSRHNGSIPYQTNSRTSLSTMPVQIASNGNQNDSSAAGSSGDDIVCNCNQSATLLTVRKEGTNKGRRFYKCASQNCDFFLWESSDTSHTSTSTNNNSRAPHIQPDVPINGEVKCNCNVAASLRTVHKQGPNTGRQFYCCAKITNGCKFFQWADQGNTSGYNGGNDGNNDGGGGGGGGGHGGPTFYGTKTTRDKGSNKTTTQASGTRAKRKCSKCGQEGHTKNKCPN